MTLDHRFDIGDLAYEIHSATGVFVGKGARFDAAKTSCSRMRPVRPLPRRAVQSIPSSIDRRKARGLIVSGFPACPTVGAATCMGADGNEGATLETGVTAATVAGWGKEGGPGLETNVDSGG